MAAWRGGYSWQPALEEEAKAPGTWFPQGAEPGGGSAGTQAPVFG